MTWGRKQGRKNVRRRYGGFSGRPQEIGPAGNAWASDDSGFARQSHGWTPQMKSLQQGAVCGPQPWGKLGMEDPANVSGEQAGYNTDMWQGYENVADALKFLGYPGTDGHAMIRQFQSDWNRVSQRIAIHPRFKAIKFKQVPRGNLVVDGDPGPKTLNALEVAILNQDIIAWRGLAMAATDPEATRLGRKHLYNAKQG